jgi:hypothetical protein
MKQFAFLITFLFIIPNLSAQTADEIIINHFNNVGGIDNWQALNGLKIKSIVKDNGMEIPSTRTSLKDGRLLVKFEIQDKEIVQIAFDGKETWGDNFMTMEAEKNESESVRNMRRQIGDFPHPLLYYKENGYLVENLGKVKENDKEYFKLKLTKNKQLVESKEIENIKYYYFDIENFKIEILESEIQIGKLKGKITKDTFDDYRKVGNIYYPFLITRSIEGMKPTEIKIKSIELNPVIKDSEFTFPEKKK